MKFASAIRRYGRIRFCTTTGMPKDSFAAIGYSRPKLIGRVLAETSLLNIAGWIVGAASTALLMRFLGEKVFRARGLFLDPFDLDAYAHTIPVPICITIFSVGTIAYRLLKLDPVTIIERR